MSIISLNIRKAAFKYYPIDNSYYLIEYVTNYISPDTGELIYLNFHSLEVVSRYSDPQLQVGEIV